MGIGERIKSRRQELGLSLQQVGAAVGVTWQSVQQWENDETAPRRSRMDALAKTLQCARSWLESGETNIAAVHTSEATDVPYSPRQIPVISWVRAGALDEAHDWLQPGAAEEWIPWPDHCSRATYALRVVGDSMEPDYRDGEVIIVDPALDPQSGDDVIVRTPSGRTTFKRLQENVEGRFLLIVNETYPNRRLEVPQDTVFCGVVIGAMRRARGRNGFKG